MKNKTPTALITAFSLLLPLGAFAQGSTGSTGSSSQTGSASQSAQSGQSGTSQQYPSSSTSGTSSQYPSSSGSSTTSGTSGTSQQYPSGSAGSSSQYPSSGSTAQSQSYPSGSSSGIAGQMSGSHSQQFKLIQEDSLKDKKRTAENMRGKKIVDRDGQTIGKIKDIGLGSVVQDSSGTSSQSFASTGSSGSVGAGAPTGRTSGSSSGIGSTSSGSMSGSSSQGDQVMLYVELDDGVGIEGDRLAAIPASQVRFDSSKEELKLQLGRSELASQLRQSGGSSSQGSGSSNR